MRLRISNELPRNAIRLKTSFQNVVSQSTFTQLPKLMIFGILGFLLSQWGSFQCLQRAAARKRRHGAKHSPLNASSTALREVRISNEFVYINVCFWLSGQFLTEFQRKASQMRFRISNELRRNAIRLKTSFQNVVSQSTFTQLPKLMIFGILGFLLSQWGSISVSSARSCAKAIAFCLLRRGLSGHSRNAPLSAVCFIHFFGFCAFNDLCKDGVPAAFLPHCVANFVTTRVACEKN